MNIYHRKTLIKQWLQILGLVLLGLAGGCGITMLIDTDGDSIPDTSIVLSETQLDDSIPTIEEVDGGAFKEDVLDLGRGATYDISSIDSFKNGVLGKCEDLDNLWGSQCVDGFALFHYQYTGRWLSTAGTGAAYGLWDARWENAGSEYEIIDGNGYIVPGEWIVTNSGKYGHVALALTGIHDGYVTVLGQNQGGSPCPSGGAAFNIINLSVKDILGGFLPKIWKAPEPVIEPTVEPDIEPEDMVCERWEVQKGDTLGYIMSVCEGGIDWERINDYARAWESVEVMPGQSVYEGWTTGYGVGLYAGDVIVRN